MNTDKPYGDEILGRGIAFPVRLEGGQIGMNAYEAQVEQSIRLILGTARGERVMRPDFGAGMEQFVFEPTNAITIALLQHRVNEALATFEPRIEVLQVSAAAGQGIGGDQLLVNIRYRLRRTDTVHNLVYPFYVERGEA